MANFKDAAEQWDEYIKSGIVGLNATASNERIGNIIHATYPWWRNINTTGTIFTVPLGYNAVEEEVNDVVDVQFD